MTQPYVSGDPAIIAVAPAVRFSGGFAGANYWFYPWLIGTTDDMVVVMAKHSKPI
jgi:hypothetical protein